MAEAVLGGIKRASGLSIVLGILMIVAGVVAMFEPGIAGVLIAYVVGWSAIFNGFAQIVFAFRTHGGLHIALEVILGVIYIVAGIFLLMNPIAGLAALTLVLASFLLVYGIFAVIFAIKMRPRNGWGWVLFDGIVTLLLGCLIWVHWPSNTPWVVGTLFGISIFFSGITRFMMSLALRRVATTAA